MTIIGVLLFLTPHFLIGIGAVLMGTLQQQIISFAESTDSSNVAASSFREDVLAFANENPKYEAWEVPTWLPYRASLGAHISFNLVFYNAARVYLLLRILPLREAEDRSLITPALSEYSRLHTLHRMVDMCQILALGIFTFNVWEWARTDVVVFWLQ